MDSAPPTFLCERCGYPLAGLGASGFCPECGLAIAESLPERRVGSPWQQRPTPRTWWRTVLGALLRPRTTLDAVRIERGSAWRLAWMSCMAAAGIGVAGIGLPLAVGVEHLLLPDRPVGIAWTLLAGVIGTVLTAGVLLGLTWIEARGLRFFGARHGHRITPAVAWAVCGHGAAGWVLAAGLGTIGGWLGAGAFLAGSPGWVTPLPCAIGVAAGFLFFEWFAWEGMRRCRFANPPEAVRDAPAPEDPAG